MRDPRRARGFPLSRHAHVKLYAGTTEQFRGPMRARIGSRRSCGAMVRIRLIGGA